MWETCIRSLGWKDPLEKVKATHFSILAWRSPWTVHVLSLVLQRVGHDWETLTSLHFTSALKYVLLSWENSLPLFNNWNVLIQILQPQWGLSFSSHNLSLSYHQSLFTTELLLFAINVVTHLLVDLFFNSLWWLVICVSALQGHRMLRYLYKCYIWACLQRYFRKKLTFELLSWAK